MRTPWIVIAVSLTLGGCGGEGSPSSPSTASTQPTTLNFSPTVAGYGYAIQDVTAFQSAGQVTATLRWNDSRKDLDLYWTNALCVIAGSGTFIPSNKVMNFGSITVMKKTMRTTPTLQTTAG